MTHPPPCGDTAIEKLLADGTIRDIYTRYGVEHRAPVPSR
jgi:hypothetical protein